MRVTWLMAMAALMAANPAAAERSMTVGPYEQERARVYTLEEMGGRHGPIHAAAACGGDVFAGADESLLALGENGWTEADTGLDAIRVTSLACSDDGLVFATIAGAYLLGDGSSRTLMRGAPNDLAAREGEALVAAGRGLFAVELASGESREVISGEAVRAVAANDDGLVYALAESGLYRIDAAGAHKVVDAPAGASEARDVAVGDDGSVYLATAKGVLSRSPDGRWERITGGDGGLPHEDVLVVSAGGGVLMAGASVGAAIRKDGEWRYRQGRQYLARDRVVDVFVESEDAIWAATPRGVSKFEFVEMTLEDKASIMEEKTRARHVRHDMVSDSDIEVAGDLSTSRTVTRDNDGLWTAMYIAAECYRHGATGDPQALEYARRSMRPLMFLETVTPLPGFVARSHALPGEPHGTGEWNHISKDGKWRWKGDTSSDEIVGHYYAYGIYHDICANEEEKEEIREKVRLITDYIIDNDYYYMDVDGEPTTWGKWNFLGLRRFRIDRGLNSLELLSHLKTAYHITGDERYERVYRELALEKGYAKFTVRQKLLIPLEVNHSDDELAFLSYYPLMKYEKDPELRRYFDKSITRSWEIERPERCPLWNFIYGAVMPEASEIDVAESVWMLERMPLDLVRWDHQNSHRDDVRIRAIPGRFGEKESALPLPPDERAVMKWNGNPYRLDGGKAGRQEEAGTHWLLPYWMGRYYGFIVEE